MENLKDSPANQIKLSLLETAWTTMVDDALRRGVYGVIAMELTIHDGTIVRVCRTVQRTDK